MTSVAAPELRVLRKQRLKNAVYTGIGTASLFTGVTALRRRSAPADVTVLMYHKVNDVPGNTLTVPPRLFREHLRILAATRPVITPEQFLAAITDGAELPSQAVLLTFDDGYLDNYTAAYPLLREAGMRALLFVATDYIGTAKVFPHDQGLSIRNPTLEWQHVREMNDVFAIGSHGQSHTVLTWLEPADAIREIHASKRIIEDALGDRVHFFSYPKGSIGHFDAQHERAVRDAGYVTAFTTTPRRNRCSELGPGHPVSRYNVEPFGPFMFRRLIDGSCDAISAKDTQLGAKAKRALNKAMRTTTR